MEKRAKAYNNHSACIPFFVKETVEDEPLPDACDKVEFEERQPAFGWTVKEIDELQHKAALNIFFTSVSNA